MTSVYLYMRVRTGALVSVRMHTLGGVLARALGRADEPEDAVHERLRR